MLAKLQRFLIGVSGRSDLVIATIILVAIIMMIIPLPTVLVDGLITVNIAASMLVLFVAFYAGRPLDFSSLPAVILLATLFRLAITITTTRLILLEGNAGEIVTAFGEFVIGGNVAVGLVVFLILTVAQFLVITKGSERVAEVAARFSLDALPGKQMSIDNELRNGDIDQAEARAMRGRLERESHLYGAMDGAMKFVKGDAIAGLVIILVNLIGGLMIGTMQHDMALGEATQVYSKLTVGDGLIAQIPALLISVAAGILVTRVASEERRDLGSEISKQLISDPRALGLAAGILAALGFAPGFPTGIFLALSLCFAGGAYWQYRRQKSAARNDPASEAAEAAKDAPEVAVGAVTAGPSRYRVTITVGPALGETVSLPRFRDYVDRVRSGLFNDLGVEAPAIELRVDQAAPEHRFRIDMEDVPVAEGEISVDHLLLEDDPVHLQLMSIPFHEGPPIFGRHPAHWVEKRHQAALSEAGIGYYEPSAALAECLSQTLRRYAGQFVGIQETRELLTRLEQDYSELVKEAQKVATLQRMAEILRRLVEENVPIRNMRLLLEGIIEWGGREQDVVRLVEQIRIALRRQICFRVAGPDRVIAAYVLERSVEDMIRSATRQTPSGSFLTISEEALRPVFEQLRRELSGVSPETSPVVLASGDVRRLVHTVLVRNEIELPVLSYQELAPEFSVQSLATISAVRPIASSEQASEQAEGQKQAAQHAPAAE